MKNDILQIMVYAHRKISAVKEEFNTVFPYLKLEFFLKPNLPNSASTLKFLKYDSKTLGEFKEDLLEAEICINPSMTVENLDQKFRDTYGLGVLVYRKSGKAWLETTLTHNWTLEEQNKQGEELSN